MAVSEDALLQHLNQLGAITQEQIEAAIQLQKSFVTSGHPEPLLSDVLIMQGIITPVLKENALKKLDAQEKGGIQQLGQYVLLKKLGEGGMGAVFLAEDTVAQRKIAVKILPVALASNSEFLTRFRREAKAAGKLNHVNIIGAYGAGEELGHHFYLMEYCEGEPLEARLKRERILDWPDALDLVKQAAVGLQYAHEQGFVHRDVKPANLFLTQDGIVKILDLGLAKNTLDAESSFQTAAGMAIGTPHYISPEQARGDKNVDGRSDIYSLGATLYHLLTGSTLYEGSSASIIMTLHMAGDVPNPKTEVPHLPDAVAEITMKMLAKEADVRYATCAQLIQDIERVLSGKKLASATFTGPVKNSTSRVMPVGRATKPQTPVGMKSSEMRSRPATTELVGHESGPLASSARSSASRNKTSRPARSGGNEFIWIYAVAGLAILAGIYFALRSPKNSEGTLSGSKPNVVVAQNDAVPVKSETQQPAPGDSDALKASASMLSEARVVQAAPVTTRTVDLLALTDPVKDGVPGVQAFFTGGALAYQPVPGAYYYWFPYVPPPEYDFSVVVTSTGTDPNGNMLALTLSHLGQEFNWLVGSRTDHIPVTCFENVQGQNWVDKNPTYRRLPEKLRDGQKYTFLIQVRNNSLRASMDGNLLSEYTTDFKDISKNSVHGKNAQLGFFGTGGWTFQSAEVTEVTGQGRRLRESGTRPATYDVNTEYTKLNTPEHWKSAENLVERVDVNADVVKGTARIEQKALIVDPQGYNARVDIPYEPPAEYDCRISFTCPNQRPKDTGGDFILVFPRNGKAVALVLGGHGNLMTGIDAINGTSYRDNPLQNKTPNLLETGKRYTVLVAVRNDHFTCWLNDRVMVDTITDYSGWEIKPGMVPCRSKAVLGVGTWGDVKTVHSFEVVDVHGRGTKVR